LLVGQILISALEIFGRSVMRRFYAFFVFVLVLGSLIMVFSFEPSDTKKEVPVKSPNESSGVDRAGESEIDESNRSEVEEEKESFTSQRTLFIGNSYTARNDLPGMYEQVLSSTENFSEESVDVESVTKGGHRLRQHAADLEDGERIADLVEDDWDNVVLQEQSQIIGFQRGHEERRKSLNSGAELAEEINGSGSEPVLFMTWGRRDGDPVNDHIYSTYPLMQERLEWGYWSLKAEIVDRGYSADIAPVGMAFEEVYNESSEEGAANRSGTAFHDLYAGDGSHPSVQGTYLSALVIAEETSGIDPEEVDYRPQGVNRARAGFLKGVASEVSSNYAQGSSSTGTGSGW
jgi:hypothetical protein